MAAATAAALELEPFPLASSRVPDAETQARSFLAKRPEADGRGIVIAVMDTGCDPGAPGLRVTSDGRPKIIDCVDCTGSGDVDTTTVLEASDGILVSPHTGRKLKLGGPGGAWSNPTGKWRVGMKQAYQLYDERLAKRVKAERRQAWDEAQRLLVAQARQRLVAFDAAHPKPEPGEQTLKRKDLESCVAELEALQRDYDDPGVLLDVVAWHDGTCWRAAVGGREDGDLSSAPAMASFAVERQWASMGDLEQMNYCVNIFDEGTVVSIVCDVSSHGTHVAGIAAACHPDDPGRNGVAPGAQVVSLKIADTRLDAMETGQGLCRAFAYCIKNKIDLINLSFGEGSSPPLSGRIIELARQTVEQHGVTFVTSAGNNGPALSTIGSPGSGGDVFITVGAHVSPAAMEAQYSMLEKVPATAYTWTSRGPTQDGSVGVTLCAPGSAITSIPNWTLSGAGLMNGTSMAAPNACGCLALVLSALKAAGISWTPASLRRAATATVLKLPGADPFAVGAGMIQVDACHEYLVAHDKLAYRDVTVSATIANRGRGLYLREPNETSGTSGTPKVVAVQVKPRFKESDPSLNRAKIDFELNVAITSTAPWVQVPPYMVLPSSGRAFNVKVDPSGLTQGEAHLAHVCGFDSARPETGPLFRVPITVIRPTVPTQCPRGQEAPVVKRTGLRFVAGHIERNFIAVPAGCTWVDVAVTTKPFDGGRRFFIVHLLQDLPHVAGSKTSADPDFFFEQAGTKRTTFRVEPEGTLEVTLAQFWSSLGATEADLEITFHGVLPEATTVNLSTGSNIACVNCVIGPGSEELKPSATLQMHRTALRPTSSTLRPCGERDLYPEGKQVYEYVLEYSFKLEEDADVTPQALLLNDKLYESLFEGQMIMLYDHAKRLVGCTDAWPTPIKMKKGDYVARLQLRHDDTKALERLKDMPLCIDRKLEKEIKVKAYPDFNSAVAASGELAPARLKALTRKAVFFAVPVDEKLPDFARPGDLLYGPCSFGEPSQALAGKKTRGGFLVQFAVMAPRPQEKKEERPPEEDPRSSAEKLADAVRDAQVKHLESLRKWSTREAHATLLGELLAKHPRHLPLLQEQLAAADLRSPDADEAEKDEAARLGRVVEAADALVAAVDQDALVAHLGRRLDTSDAEAVRRGREQDAAKVALVDALSKKILALAKQCPSDGGAGAGAATEGSGSVAALNAAHATLKSLVDVSEAKYGRTVAAFEAAHGRLGSALAALQKHLADEKAPSRELLELRASVLARLGFDAWHNHEQKSLLVRFPKAYSRF